jgi:hypothetical protein
MLQRPSSWFLLRGRDLQEKVLGFLALFICIELIIFKFLPDLSTALVQEGTSTLADFDTFHRYYLTPGSVHYARFLGSRIMIFVADSLAHVIRSQDVRLHPLRVAAGLLTPLYAYVGAILAVQTPNQYSWRHFLVLYAVVAVMGLYVFYPGDMPSFALLSIALYCLLRERLGFALLFLLLTGLFRESSLHAVFFVFVWALCVRSRPISARIAWVIGFGAAFAVEYVAIRHFFKGPVSSSGGVILDPRRLFLEPGMYSLTTICSLGLALIIVLACLLKIKSLPRDDWRYWFFRLNCYALPFWIVFYRSLNGNISEFRMMWPVLLPCIYGIAYAANGSKVASVGATAPRSY